MKDESKILESEAKHARIMPLRSIHFPGTSIKDFRVTGGSNDPPYRSRVVRNNYPEPRASARAEVRAS